jgi:tetratricopeptide (TPR) repeat protein
MKKFWIILQLIWLYVRYWGVGLTKDYFYISKANYLFELGHYEKAIRSYKRALKDANNLRLRIHDMIDYCYSLMGRGDDGIDYYRRTFEKTNDPLIGLGLASAEFQRGNLEKSQDLINGIRNTSHRFDTSKLDDLEAEIQVVKKQREQMKHGAEEFKRFELEDNDDSNDAGRVRRA